MSKKAFHSIVTRFQGVNNLGVRLTLADGEVRDVSRYVIRGNSIVDGEGASFSMDDVSYIEIGMLP